MRAIIPRRKPIRPTAIRAAVRRGMDRFAADVMSKTKYPPQAASARPVYRRSRKTGRRTLVRGYRRTGTLRRSWWQHVFERGGAIIAQIASNSNVAPYNRRVQGSKDEQAPLFDRYRWKRVPDEAEALWPKHEKLIDNAVLKEVA